MNHTSFQFICQASITGAPQQVLTALLSHCYSRGDCFPSVKRIATIAGISVRTVHRALRRLQELEIITIVHRFNKEGKKRSNFYILNGLQEMLDQSGTKENRQGICHDGTYKKSSVRAKKTYDRDSEQKNSGSALKNDGDESLHLSNELEKPKTNTKAQIESSNSSRKKSARHFSFLETPKKQAFKLDGILDLPKIMEIFEAYTARGYLKKTVGDLINLLACCSWLNSEEKRDLKRTKKKIRNKYGLLTYLTKTKQLAKPIKWCDDEKARRTIIDLRNKGLIDF